MDVLPIENIATENSTPKQLTVKVVKKHKEKKDKHKELAKEQDEDKTKLINELIDDEKNKKKPEAKKLKKKLQEVAEQNESLSKAIDEKNGEISELRRSIQSLNEVLNSVPIDELRCNSSIAGNKLLDLSQKNRTLSAHLEQAKNQIHRRDYEIQKLQKELKVATEKLQQDAELLRKGNTSPLEELQSKMTALQQKWFETRNKNTELQTQLKLAQKVMQQEIGENFNLTAFSTRPGQSNWRGRAQQILHLQQREKELREKLDSYEQQVGPLNVEMSQEEVVYKKAKNINLSEKSHSARLNVQSVRSNASFDRARPEVNRTQILNRAKIEALEKEIVQLKGTIEQGTTKMLALRVRNKNLNEQLANCKANHCTQQQLEEFSNINVTSVMGKLNKQKEAYDLQIEDLRLELEKQLHLRTESQYKEDSMRTKYEEMDELLVSKDSYIQELKEHIISLENDMKALCGGFLFSCRELNKEEFIGILDALEAEKNEVVGHNKTLDNRLKTERSKTDQLSDQVTKYKIKVSRLEAKIRELEKEIDSLQERKKRTQRIAEYANSVSNLTTGRSVTSFTFENSSALNTGTIAAPTANHFDANQQREMDDLKNQLQLANEKLVLLNEKVAFIVEEKENDAKTFEHAMLNSKTILLETILSNKVDFPHSRSQTPNELDLHSLGDTATV